MAISDIIENYIKELLTNDNEVIIKRNDLANYFNCVPSQINYVIATRFIPELGFYVESRRGGGGYIKISKVNISKSDYISSIMGKIGHNLSQSVIDIYLNDFIRYNVLDLKTVKLIKAAVSDKSLSNVDRITRDSVRADIFKNIIINLL